MNRTVVGHILMACLLMMVIAPPVRAFRVYDASPFGFGIARWDAAPRSIDGVDRSLQGGLTYSVSGGSYEAFRDQFSWAGTPPGVAAFQAAVEAAFATWEAIDPETGLGTPLRFVPDFGTQVVAEPFPTTPVELFRLNRGADIDLLAQAGNRGTDGQVQFFGDPTTKTLTLTSGVENYAGGAISGVDIYMNTVRSGQPWDLHKFQNVLSHEIGHAIGLGDVDSYHGADYGVLTHFYDDNYDGTTSTTAAATLTNSFAALIDPLDPDHSPLMRIEVCQPSDPTDLQTCVGDPGIDSPDAVVHMEGTPTKSNRGSGLQNDDFAGRQFLYPFVRVAGDFNGDSQVTVDDIDLLSIEVRRRQPRRWFDLTGDGSVDLADREHWVRELKRTYFGDANLDGEFNSKDFVEVFLAGTYEVGIGGHSSWRLGDWNGDSEFTSADFIVAMKDGGYEVGPRGAGHAVPEPGSWTWVLVTTVAVVVHRHRGMCRRQSDGLELGTCQT